MLQKGSRTGSRNGNRRKKIFLEFEGYNLFGKRNLDSAIAIYETSVSNDPDHIGINRGNYFQLLSETYVRKREFQAAISSFQTLSKVGQPNWTRLGIAYMEEGDITSAEIFYLKITQQFPE